MKKLIITILLTSCIFTTYATELNTQIQCITLQTGVNSESDGPGIDSLESDGSGIDSLESDGSGINSLESDGSGIQKFCRTVTI